MSVKILSLYDGMACGMIAMQLAGVEVESYDAYEIDKCAIKTAQHNFPMIKEHGDVFDADFTQYEGVDFLIGGSPCTYWSIAQTKNRETVASGMGWELFSQYVRALHEAKPKYFIYENNKSMSKQIRASIDEAFGFEAVLINSALVSAQNRQRLYWVGRRNEDGTYSKVNVEQPADRGILLKDVLDSVVARDLTCNDKSYTLTASHDGACAWNTIERHQRNMVAEPINVTDDGKSQTLKAQYCKNNVANFCCYSSTYGASGVAEPVNVTADGKAQCLRATCYKDGIRNIVANEADNKTGVAEPINDIYQVGAMPRPDGEISTSAGFRIYSTEAKGRYLCANGGGAGAKTGLYATPVRVGDMPSAEGKICGSQSKRIYSIEGKASSICATETGGNSDTSSPATRLYAVPCGEMGSNTGLYAIPTMPVKEATAKGYTEIECGECVDLSMPNSKTRRGRSMADKANCMQTSNEFYQYVGYVIEFDEEGRPIKAIGKDGKEITIYEVKDGKITIKGKQYPIKLKDGYYIIRKLTVSECKRLQTVPEWYEFPVSNSQAYKMLGNGWTCEVIAHLIRSCNGGTMGIRRLTMDGIGEKRGVKILSLFDGMACGMIAMQLAGCKFAIGCEDNGKLCGVAICGRPVSRYLDDGKTVEVVRLCTDGTKDVCSFLYAKAARIAKEMGYEKIITYILESENGISLKAAGWKQESVTKGGEWNRKSRPRNTTAPTVPKKRYGKNLTEKRTSFRLDSPMVSDAGLHHKIIEEVFK